MHRHAALDVVVREHEAKVLIELFVQQHSFRCADDLVDIDILPAIKLLQGMTKQPFGHGEEVSSVDNAEKCDTVFSL